MDTASDRTVSAEQAVPKAAPDRAAPKRGSPARWIALTVAAAAAAGALIHWQATRFIEDTDDAQIDGDISNVGSRVAGVVKAVYVTEDQPVKAGDLLVELDPADLAVLVERAKAQVAQAAAELQAEDPSVSIQETSNSASTASASSDVSSAVANFGAAKQAVSQLAAQLEQAKASDRQAKLDEQRDSRLIATSSISQAEYDRSVNAAAASAAGVQALEQSLAAAKDRVHEAQAKVSSAETHLVEVRSNAPKEIDTRRASVLVRQASLDLARADLEQATLNLSYARIHSPVDGIVNKKAVAVGDHVAAGAPLIAITQTKRMWATANFRETQVRRIAPGQRATVHVDALDIDLHGVVEAIGGATGSRLSILPPENASGNYVKVVQRIPVRIRIDPGQPGLDRLRPGMSVEPEVRVQ